MISGSGERVGNQVREESESGDELEVRVEGMASSEDELEETPGADQPMREDVNESRDYVSSLQNESFAFNSGEKRDEQKD